MYLYFLLITLLKIELDVVTPLIAIPPPANSTQTWNKRKTLHNPKMLATFVAPKVRKFKCALATKNA